VREALTLSRGSLLGGELLEESLQRRLTPALAHLDDPPRLQVEHEGQITLPFVDGHPIRPSEDRRLSGALQRENRE
jgi:hypothetical protein